MTDEDRLARVAQGDRRAMEQLYEQYERLVYSFALRIICDPHLAEEVVQDVFVRVWKQASRFDRERGRFSSWLINMTRNMTIDRVRASRSRGMIPLVRPDESDIDLHDEAAPDLADAAINALHVREAISLLNAEQREALDLAYWHGLTHVEIARRTRTPLGTVKSRLHHALIKLRTVLNPVSGEEGVSREGR